MELFEPLWLLAGFKYSNTSWNVVLQRWTTIVVIESSSCRSWWFFIIGKHVFVECWATYKHTYLTLIDWGEILALKLWSQNLTPVKILKTCLPIGGGRGQPIPCSTLVSLIWLHWNSADRFFTHERCLALLLPDLLFCASVNLRIKGLMKKFGLRSLRSCQLWFIVASAARALSKRTRGGTREVVIVSGHGTLGFLASGRLVETRL